MLGKLIKYDLKSYFKTFPLIWLAAVVLAFVNHFTLRHFTEGETSGVVQVLGMVLPILVYVAVIVVLAVLTLLLVIRRFYSGALKEEGYLTFTLPVKPWQIVVAKAIAATVITLITSVVTVISVMLLMDWSDVAEVISDLTWGLFHNEYLTAFQSAILCVELLLTIIVSIAASVYQIYCAIALGHLFNKHRAGMAVLMYIVINVILSSLGTTMVSLVLVGGGNWIEEFFDKLTIADNAFSFGSTVLVISFLLSAVQVVIYHIVTERILSKRLNLE